VPIHALPRRFFSPLTSHAGLDIFRSNSDYLLREIVV
jgi:hypothetical protein